MPTYLYLTAMNDLLPPLHSSSSLVLILILHMYCTAQAVSPGSLMLVMDDGSLPAHYPTSLYPR